MDETERQAWLKDRLKWRHDMESGLKVFGVLFFLFALAFFGFFIASDFSVGGSFVMFMTLLGIVAYAHAKAHKAAREELAVLCRLFESEDLAAQDAD